MRAHGRSPAHASPASGVRRHAKTLLGPAKTVARPPLFGRDAGPFERVETHALCTHLNERLGERATAKGVDIHQQLSCSHVRVQPAPFAEALYELTDNAIEAAAPGHPVLIEVRSTPEGDVLWQIHDHGEGMSVHGLRELGQPTSGLGVMFAWAVVEHHGGLLHFESAPGGGTTATIWLPG
jgi:two-component system sensor histidine kinase HydH